MKPETYSLKTLEDFERIIISKPVAGKSIPYIGGLIFDYKEKSPNGVFFWGGELTDANLVYSHVVDAAKQNGVDASFENIWFCTIKKVHRADVTWKTPITPKQKYDLVNDLKQVFDGYVVDTN